MELTGNTILHCRLLQRMTYQSTECTCIISTISAASTRQVSHFHTHERTNGPALTGGGGSRYHDHTTTTTQEPHCSDHIVFLPSSIEVSTHFWPGLVLASVHTCHFSVLSSPQSEPASHCGAAQLAVLCAGVLPSPGLRAYIHIYLYIMTCRLLVWGWAWCMYMHTHVYTLFVADWSGDYSVEQLRCVQNLAVEFSVFISPQQLRSPLHTRQLLQHTLPSLFPASVGSGVPAKVLRSAITRSLAVSL